MMKLDPMKMLLETANARPLTLSSGKSMQGRFARLTY